MCKKLFIYAFVTLMGAMSVFSQGTESDKKNVLQDKNKLNNDKAARDQAAHKGKAVVATREQKLVKNDKKNLRMDRKVKRSDSREEHQEKKVN